MKNPPPQLQIKEIFAVNKIKLEQICRKFNLKFLTIFGSQLTPFVHTESDLDIGYMAYKQLTADQIDTLFCELSKIFHRNIDLVDLTQTNYILLMEVFKNNFVLYEAKKGLFVEIMSRAFINYQDFKKYYQQFKDLI